MLHIAAGIGIRTQDLKVWYRKSCRHFKENLMQWNFSLNWSFTKVSRESLLRLNFFIGLGPGSLFICQDHISSHERLNRRIIVGPESSERLRGRRRHHRLWGDRRQLWPGHWKQHWQPGVDIEQWFHRIRIDYWKKLSSVAHFSAVTCSSLKHF